MCFVITFNYLLSYQAIFLHDQKVSRMKGGFKLKLEMFFIIFKGLSVARNSLRLESLSLIIIVVIILIHISMKRFHFFCFVHTTKFWTRTKESSCNTMSSWIKTNMYLSNTYFFQNLLIGGKLESKVLYTPTAGFLNT